LKPLHQLVPGEKAFIVDMRNEWLCEKLFELGIFPGDLVEVKEISEDENSIVVHINNHIFNIYKQTAETIITNVVSFSFHLN
jgi:Fe2+ transport system protein FeoA